MCSPFIMMTFRFRLRHFNKIIPNAYLHLSRSVNCLIHCISCSVSLRIFSSCLFLSLLLFLALSAATRFGYAKIYADTFQIHWNWRCFFQLFSFRFFFVFHHMLKKVFFSRKGRWEEEIILVFVDSSLFFMEYTGKLGWFLLLCSSNFLFLMITSQFDSISHLCSSFLCAVINIHRLLRDTYLSDTHTPKQTKEGRARDK